MELWFRGMEERYFIALPKPDLGNATKFMDVCGVAQESDDPKAMSRFLQQNHHFQQQQPH